MTAEVDGGVVEEEEATLSVIDVAIDSRVHHAHALVVDELGLLHELSVCEGVVLQGVDLLGHALGVVDADELSEVGRGRVGLRDRHRRRLGVDVHRRRVELELWVDRAQVEAHDAADPHHAHREHVEVDVGEVAPLPGLHDDDVYACVDRDGL